MGRDEAIKDMKMYMANDWDLAEETPEYFLLKRNKQTVFGHIVIGVFTIWWTLGLANILYWFVKNEKKKILK